MPKKAIAEILFYMHVLVFLIWVGLFLVPLSLWPARITFHFWYITSIIAIELFAGILMIPVKCYFSITCPLSNLMQKARGYPFSDPRNFNHSFVRELFERLHIKLPPGFVGACIFISWIIVIVQYLT